MFKYLYNLFIINCNKYYKSDVTAYIRCLNNKNTHIINLEKQIYIIHEDIYKYIDIADIYLKTDYTKYITYDQYTYKKIRRTVYVKDLFIIDGYILTNRNELMSILISKLSDILSIYSILRDNSDNRVNNFNSNIIKQYIINVVDILNVSVNQD